VTLAALAQKPPARIGLLASGSPASFYTVNLIKAIKQGLSDSGLVEGRDYSLQPRYGEGDYERFPALAQELARAGITIILAHTIASVRAAQKLDPPIAVVMIPEFRLERTHRLAGLEVPHSERRNIAGFRGGGWSLRLWRIKTTSFHSVRVLRQENSRRCTTRRLACRTADAARVMDQRQDRKSAQPCRSDDLTRTS